MSPRGGHGRRPRARAEPEHDGPGGRPPAGPARQMACPAARRRAAELGRREAGEHGQARPRRRWRAARPWRGGQSAAGPSAPPAPPSASSSSAQGSTGQRLASAAPPKRPAPEAGIAADLPAAGRIGAPSRSRSASVEARNAARPPRATAPGASAARARRRARRGQLEQPLQRDAAQEDLRGLEHRVHRPGLRPHQGDQQPARRDADALAREAHGEARPSSAAAPPSTVTARPTRWSQRRGRAVGPRHARTRGRPGTPLVGLEAQPRAEPGVSSSPARRVTDCPGASVHSIVGEADAVQRARAQHAAGRPR